MSYSKRFLQFIRIWQEDFGIESSIDSYLCEDKDGNPLPWYTYPAIEYLVQFDYSEKRVFEFGCGYSSLFWANRAHSVIGIENNTQWFVKWQHYFHRPNLSIRFIPEDKLYSQAILDENGMFDVIIIDGRCRCDCVRSAITKLAPNGFIILDDSDRTNTSKEYSEAIKTLKENNLLQVDFYGFCPMNNYPKATSIFFSRNFNFSTLSPVQPINGIGNLWGKSRKARKEFYKENK